MPAPRLVPLVAALTLLAGTMTVSAAAEAATYTSTGLRCTKVGTAGADRIVGTAKRDVICGRGGNDVIDGRGGNDVIDGGLGNDTLRGSLGNDRLLGGLGNDSLWGQTGADSVTAAGGNDRVDGGDGNDVISAGAGNDTIATGAGNDRVTAGAGNDTATGVAGNDVLLGEAGNDDLLGGAGSDTINGGAGTNWCDATSTDTETSCKTDLEMPQVHEFSVSPTTVDVTDGTRVVTATYRLTDDTGIRVPLGGVQELVRGTVRDGWWTSRWVIPQYATPGTREWSVNMTDRVGRSGGHLFPDAFTVINDHPDLEPPEVQSMTLSPATVDVRSAAKKVTGTVRITDDRAGVRGAYLCPAHRLADSYWTNEACEWMERVSGTTRDGTWRASATIPRGSAGGQWNFQVWVEDASDNHPQQYYFGPDQVQWERAHSDTEPWWKPLPDGAGRFTVVGTTDNNAPQLTTMTLNPATVDVRTRSRTVTIDVAATDVEGISGLGITAQGHDESVDLGSDDSPELVSGTEKDGVWRLQLPVVQGTPPGTYDLQLWVEDATHFVSWFSPGSYTYDSSQHLFTPEQAPNGAVITVE